MEPILAPRLDEKNLTTMQIGLFFAIFPCFYIPCSVLVNFISNKIERRVRMILSSIISCVGLLCVGPSSFLHFPDSIPVMCVGQAIVGAMLANQLIPGLPEMEAAAVMHFPKQERKVNNMSAGIFNSFLGIGQIVAPLYGSTANQFLGFQNTTTIAAGLDLVFAIIYFTFAGGYSAFRNTCRNFRSPGVPLSPIARSKEERDVRRASPLLSPHIQ